MKTFTPFIILGAGLGIITLGVLALFRILVESIQYTIHVPGVM